MPHGQSTSAARHVLTGGPGLDALLRRIDRLAQVQQRLRALLPQPLCDHLLVAGTDHRVLLLLTDSAAWAARLRFQAEGLLQAAREQCGLPVDSVKVKVCAASPREPAAAPRPRLAPRSAEFLRDCADTESDPGLRDVLRRLSRNV